MSYVEELRRERQERLQRFERAAAQPKVKPRIPVQVIPNTPFGTPKIKPVAPVSNEDIEEIKRQRRAERILEAGYSLSETAASPRPVKIDVIQTIVAQFYGISRMDLLTHRRDKAIVIPRQIGMYLAKKLTLRSLPEIGRRFAGRDHTTVLHAVRKIERLEREDSELAKQIAFITEIIREGA